VTKRPTPSSLRDAPTTSHVNLIRRDELVPPPVPRGVHELKDPFKHQTFEVSNEALSQLVAYPPKLEPPERIQSTSTSAIFTTKTLHNLWAGVAQDESRREKRLMFVSVPVLIVALVVGVLVIREPAKVPPPAEIPAKVEAPKPQPEAVPPSMVTPPAQNAKAKTPTATVPKRKASDRIHPQPAPDDFDVNPFRPKH
jgi:hypothetical protein